MAETEPWAEPEFPPHRMSIDRYQRMVEAGVYGAKDPVYLWEGRLVETLPKSPPYSFAAMSLLNILVKMVPEGWHVGYRIPLAIGPESMPEPDLMVVRGDPEDYVGRARTARDVAFLIEVSDSSLALGLNDLKHAAYVADGIPEYWSVDLPRREIMVFRKPSEASGRRFYREDWWYGSDDAIPVVLDGREVGRVAVKEFLV